MRNDFGLTDFAVAVLAGTAVIGFFVSQPAPAAELPTSAGANACAQWHLSAADFSECQSLWNTARNSTERKEIEKRFQARGMVFPGSRQTPVTGGGDPDAATRPGTPGGARNADPSPTGEKTGTPGNLSAAPPK